MAQPRGGIIGSIGLCITVLMTSAVVLFLCVLLWTCAMALDGDSSEIIRQKLLVNLAAGTMGLIALAGIVLGILDLLLRIERFRKWRQERPI